MKVTQLLLFIAVVTAGLSQANAAKCRHVANTTRATEPHAAALEAAERVVPAGKRPSPGGKGPSNAQRESGKRGA